MIDKSKLDILENISTWQDSDTFGNVQELVNGSYDTVSKEVSTYEVGIVSNCNIFREFIEDYYNILSSGLENGFLGGIDKDLVEGKDLDTFLDFGIYYMSKGTLNIPSKVVSDFYLCNIQNKSGITLQIVYGLSESNKTIYTYRIGDADWVDIPDIDTLNEIYFKITGGIITGSTKINNINDISDLDKSLSLEVVGNTLFRNKSKNPTIYSTTVKNDFVIAPFGSNDEDTGSYSVSTRVCKSTLKDTENMVRGSGYYTYNIKVSDSTVKNNSITINLDASLEDSIGYCYVWGTTTKAEHLIIDSGAVELLHNDFLKLNYNRDGLVYPFDNEDLIYKNSLYVVNLKSIYDLYEYVDKNFLYRKSNEIGSESENSDNYMMLQSLSISSEVDGNHNKLKFISGDNYGGTIECGDKTFNIVTNGNLSFDTQNLYNNVYMLCEVPSTSHNLEVKLQAGITDNAESNPQGTYGLGYVSIKENMTSETDVTSSISLCVQRKDLVDKTYKLAYKSVGLYGTQYKTEFIPSEDNVINLGSTSNRWQNIYAGSDVITTSDKSIKTNISKVSSNILNKWENIKWVEFKYKDGSRKHTGLVAQEVLKAVPEIEDYGALCKDSWDNIYNIEIDPETGKEEKTLVKKAGSLYSLRYNEIQAIENQYLRNKISELEKRLEKLEKGSK